MKHLGLTQLFGQQFSETEMKQMTNAKLTDVTMIIDKSPSMLELVDDTIEGFNSFLERQKLAVKQSGNNCDLQVIQFDERYEPGQRANVLTHAPLDSKSYAPRASADTQTALLDAIGRAIEDTGKRLASMPESQRPGKVLFVVITDGYDNASKHFTADQIREKVSLQHGTYKWDFVYLGANQDAWAVGEQFGFKHGKVLSTAATKAGTQVGFDVTAKYVANTVAAPDADTAIEQKFSAEDVRRARQASNTGMEARA